MDKQRVQVDEGEQPQLSSLPPFSEEITLRVLRGEPNNQYWEEFVFPYREEDNIISLLMALQRMPVAKGGKKVAPVVWESGCLEEVCGSCSILVNGKPRQACTALVRNIVQESQSSVITLAPLSKFPLVRDLVVDRTRMFDHLKKISGWVEVESYSTQESGPEVTPQKQEVMYSLSTCMTCGCCTESCPQVNSSSSFMGPAPISQVRYFSIHPTARAQHKERIRVMQDDGGVGGCGNAQNCVRVCPKKIPLTDSIGAIGREATLQAIKDIFGLPEKG